MNEKTKVSAVWPLDRGVGFTFYILSVEILIKYTGPSLSATPDSYVFT